MEYLEYAPESMYTEKLAFKILIIVSLLADSNLAYRGTLQDLSKALGYSEKADTARYRRMRAAIEQLEKLDLIKTIKDGNIYTLSLSNVGKKKTIRIARDIVKSMCGKLIHEKTGNDWSNTLKVLFNIYYHYDNTDIDNNRCYYKEIANELGISSKAVGKSIKRLKEFEAILTKEHWIITDYGENVVDIRREATTIIPTAWIKAE